MLLSEIYRLCNYISNKHDSGNAFTPGQYNSLLEILARNFFKKKVEESSYLELNRNISEQSALQTSKLMREFRKNEVIANGNNTSFEFAYLLGLHDDDNNTLIEFITEDEYHDRAGDSILAPGEDAPVAMIRDGVVEVEPATIANINISYYRYPLQPVCDYYIDADGVLQFLGQGETHVWQNGEIDSDGDARVAGDPDWDSRTQELEFNEDFHENFIQELLVRVGIRLNERDVMQYAKALEQEEKQM